MTPTATQSKHFDVIILGGGAAGLMCALQAGGRGKTVLVLEVSNKLGKKILMSGGGRCNFTNLDVSAEHFICSNPHFVKSALSQYSQWDFISMVDQHAIAYHEKSHGQLFCDVSAKQILKMLVDECEAVNVQFGLESQARDVVAVGDGYKMTVNGSTLSCNSLVIASGGLSIPTLGGATGQGYYIAEQFGLTLNPREASLVPFTLSGKWHEFSSGLSGVSVPVSVSTAGKKFSEQLLFTHRGLSGPAILQISNYWNLGKQISIDLLPTIDAQRAVLAHKAEHPQSTLTAWLTQLIPASLAQALSDEWWPDSAQKSLQEWKDKELTLVAAQLNKWVITPSGTEGYRTAEVTRGGVGVGAISSQTMQVEGLPGLYFIGEVLDVTGHLGGYNFQWAWSSGFVAGLSV